MLCPRKPERALASPGLDLHVGAGQSWELDLGPLEEQPGLLTCEPSLQPPIKIICIFEFELVKYLLLCFGCI